MLGSAPLLWWVLSGYRALNILSNSSPRFSENQEALGFPSDD